MKHRSHLWAAATLTGVLLSSSLPAFAAPLPAPSTPGVTSAPAQTPSPTPAQPSAAPATEAPVPSPAPADPSAPADVEVPPGALVSDEALAELEKEMGRLGASMGQGLERIREGADPQQVTDSTDPNSEPGSDARPEGGASSPSASGATASDGSGSGGMDISTMSSTVAAPQSVMAPMAGNWMPPGIQGIDVSGWQGNVDWPAQVRQNVKFAYVKATEGHTFRSDYYAQQYNGAASVGIPRGAYHFALPSASSGAVQANYFVDNGGGWSADGRTLPPLLDVEYNPYSSLGNTCYNMSASQMISWIRDFSNTIKARTGRAPMIYTTAGWWQTCTGNTTAFADHPLHIAAYPAAGYEFGPDKVVIPGGWRRFDVWQYSSTGPFIGDSNVWHGSQAELDAFVRGGSAAGGYTVYAPGAIGQAWAASGGNNGSWGPPTNNESCTSGYCYQTFQNYSAYWTPADGVRIVYNHGAIANAWRAAGGASGPWGVPTNNETSGGHYSYQTFQNHSAYWTAARGVKSIYNHGAIANTWRANGGATGTWGIPTNNESCTSGYCNINFERQAAFWTSGGGVKSIYTPGAIGGAWLASGGATGTWGIPTSNESCTSGYCSVTFQRQNAYWTPADGVKSVYLPGAIGSAWRASGGATGTWGLPTSNETCTSGYCYQTFRDYSAYWTAAGGIKSIYNHGGIATSWRANGGANGTWGIPTSQETCNSTYCIQAFQRQQAVWTPSRGVASVYTPGAIGSAWLARGGAGGTWGIPTSNETCNASGVCTQAFQNARVTWTASRGVTWV
jgi:GH25 family lysozyme M1 (1,4-beta-N-acetylmuramidase)